MALLTAFDVSTTVEALEATADAHTVSYGEPGATASQTNVSTFKQQTLHFRHRHHQHPLSTPVPSPLHLLLPPFEGGFERESDFLTHPVYNSYHSESLMLRYLAKVPELQLKPL